jgi:hypothetical protein
MYTTMLLIGLLTFYPAGSAVSDVTVKATQPIIQLSDKDQVAITVMEFLIREGIPSALAAGIAGNIAQESNFVASVAGRSGIGFCQWCGYRKANLMRLAAAHKKSWRDPLMQAKFIHHELTLGTESEILPRLLNAKDASTAATLVCRLYERPRPSAANLSFRRSEARRLHSLWERICKTQQNKNLAKLTRPK